MVIILKPSDRLREERNRLGLSQTALAKVATVSKQSQIRYESGEGGGQDVAYLTAVSEIGIDIGYVLTGVRTIRRPGIPAAEMGQFNDMVDTFWNLSDDGRTQVLHMAEALVNYDVTNKGGTRGIKKLPSKKK